MTQSTALPPPAALEDRRVQALHDYDVLDTPPESVFDDIARIASTVCNTPMALISLVETGRQWFKAGHGADVHETAIEPSICAQAILEDALLVVPDTLLDRRFADNPWVTGTPHVRFYAGAVLKTPEGLAIGAVCVLDRVARGLTEAQGQGLLALARQVMAQLELRRMLARSERISQYRASLLPRPGTTSGRR